MPNVSLAQKILEKGVDGTLNAMYDKNHTKPIGIVSDRKAGDPPHQEDYVVSGFFASYRRRIAN
jgi:hypothetical protein